VARFGLPKSRRLLRRSQFDSVLSQPCVSRDRYFVVSGAPNAGPEARLGLVVSRRVSPLAVARNRIKRLARESFRFAAEGLAGLDFVVMARNAAAEASNDELRESLARHWKRLNAQCKPS
jgi:ribonuclease P protein component